MMGTAPALLLASALLTASIANAEPWRVGRATWFDVGPDMSTANCHYNWSPTGRNVGAWPDVQDGFSSSCGKCYEVKCRNMDLQDGYGATLSRSNACYDESKSVIITIVDACPKCYEVKCRNMDLQDGYGATLSRSNACYDESKSVIITIVDACPCRYPNNQYSNKRWCCGDMDHLDISQEVFEQLADLNKGVIGLSYREVDCSAAGSPGTGTKSTSGSSTNGNDYGKANVDGGYATGTGSSSQPSSYQGQSSNQGQSYSTNKGWRSCKCYEVKCRNMDLQDGYGATLSRSNACYDESKSVIITIVDACPKCYEVKCRNMDLQDGYGATLSRSNACYDESKSVIITIVDACPWETWPFSYLYISQEVLDQVGA
ncbi:hypothetical protein GPECTOR_1g36 [Gonium pectorale]|uniref:Expansin-like EG45 domain-containing protein n=1 Tax=Gonium pectorale TaxID=33097 RepID=A0A150H2Z9_GONPE|nr:hypothetical protein GPECTOR_1g36 [Gonium pectorale]|eukprot:KXZ56404.1 hypothetical protein GPECTOR_1g36 [Gonium pectorale]